MSDDKVHVDDSDEYSQLFGIVIGHPPDCDLFTEIDKGYVIDATPNKCLRELIERWREDKVYGIHYANELEAVIDDE